MMKSYKWKKDVLKAVLPCILVVAMLLGTLTACSKEEKPQYTANQDYLLGMCELTSETMTGQVDSAVTGDWVATKMGELGVKTVRIWMHHRNICYRAENSNEVYINKDVAEKYHAYIAKLKENGVERILVMNHNFLHPYGFVGDDMSLPDPYEEPELYLDFLQMYEKIYQLIAAEFPEVEYFEPGNEWDDEEQGLYFHRAGYAGNGDTENTYTTAEAAKMAADLCWYANRGVKSSNPNAKIVSPGTTYNESGKNFLDTMYRSIQEGRHPTGEEYADTDYDNYFQIVAFHPYLQVHLEKMEDEEAISEWTQYNLGWHDILVKYGDGDKTMWMTEFGLTDDRYRGSNGAEVIANRMELALNSIRENMPWVETVFYFRLATCEEHKISNYENGFGLFYSPNHEDSDMAGTPKTIAKMLYRYFNGTEATKSTFSK